MEFIHLVVAFLVGAVFFLVFGNNKKSSSKTPNKGTRSYDFVRIADRHSTLAGVQEALRQSGLESSQLILGIDYTKSNMDNGRRTFGGKCLHDIAPGALDEAKFNPYQKVIAVLGRTLEAFDDDKVIPAYGFGDSRTTNKDVFKLHPNKPLVGFQSVLERYRAVTPLITMAGPTNFAPIIRESIKICEAEKAYHILVIIADGQVINVNDTKSAIVEASSHPLSIVMVGVGDGPWDTMEFFDDFDGNRRFDNFQFVDFNKHKTEHAFAVAALQEIPDQYQAIKDLQLI